MNKSSADKYRHKEQPMDLYGRETQLINSKKGLKFTIGNVRSETILARRIRLTEPSKLTTISGEAIRSEPAIFEALAIGKNCEQYIDIKVGDRFIATDSEGAILHENCDVVIDGKANLAFEIVKAYNIISTGIYELSSK